MPLIGEKWEFTNVDAVKLSITNPPKCLLEEVKKKMTRSMHVFLRGNQITLQTCRDENKKIPPNPNSGSSLKYLDAAIFFLCHIYLFLLPH